MYIHYTCCIMFLKFNINIYLILLYESDTSRALFVNQLCV